MEPAGSTGLLLSYVERRDHGKRDESGSRNGLVDIFRSALSSLCVLIASLINLLHKLLINCIINQNRLETTELQPMSKNRVNVKK